MAHAHRRPRRGRPAAPARRRHRPVVVLHQHGVRHAGRHHVDELHVELFHPADEATAAAARGRGAPNVAYPRHRCQNETMVVSAPRRRTRRRRRSSPPSKRCGRSPPPRPAATLAGPRCGASAGGGGASRSRCGGPVPGPDARRADHGRRRRGVFHDGLDVDRVDGLEPDTEYERHGIRFRTLARPAGALRCRIGTVNDVHFGEVEAGRIDAAAGPDHARRPVARRTPRR